MHFSSYRRREKRGVGDGGGGGGKSSGKKQYPLKPLCFVVLHLCAQNSYLRACVSNSYEQRLKGDRHVKTADSFKQDANVEQLSISACNKSQRAATQEVVTSFSLYQTQFLALPTAVAVTVFSHNMCTVHIYITVASCALTSHQRGFLSFSLARQKLLLFGFSPESSSRLLLEK